MRSRTIKPTKKTVSKKPLRPRPALKRRRMPARAKEKEKAMVTAGPSATDSFPLPPDVKTTPTVVRAAGVSHSVDEVQALPRPIPNGVIVLMCYLVIVFFIHLSAFYSQAVADRLSVQTVLALVAVAFCFFSLWKQQGWGWRLSMFWFSYQCISVIVSAILKYMNRQEFWESLGTAAQRTKYPLLAQKFAVIFTIIGYAFSLALNAFIVKYLFDKRIFFCIPADQSLFDALLGRMKREVEPVEYCCSSCGTRAIVGQERCTNCGELFEDDSTAALRNSGAK